MFPAYFNGSPFGRKYEDSDTEFYILLTNAGQWLLKKVNSTGSNININSVYFMNPLPDVLDPALYEGGWIRQADSSVRNIEFLSSDVVSFTEAKKSVISIPSTITISDISLDDSDLVPDLVSNDILKSWTED